MKPVRLHYTSERQWTAGHKQKSPERSNNSVDVGLELSCLHWFLG